MEESRLFMGTFSTSNTVASVVHITVYLVFPVYLVFHCISYVSLYILCFTIYLVFLANLFSTSINLVLLTWIHCVVKIISLLGVFVTIYETDTTVTYHDQFSMILEFQKTYSHGFS